MPDHIIDSTLPAYDPNFPKPRGFVPVADDVAASVADFEARFIREHGAPMTPEARQRILDDWTLNYYYDNSYLAYRRTPRGVEVLAVGWEEVRKYLNDNPPETRQNVEIRVV
jgi:hypothetical protein